MTGRKPPELSKRRQFALRTILAQLTASAVIATAFSVGAVAFVNSRATVKELSSEVFLMEAGQVNTRVIEYSTSARHIVDLNSALIGDGVISPAELREIGGHCIDVIRANPRLSSSGFGTPDGEAMWVTIDPDKELRVQSYSRDDTGTMIRRSFLVDANSDWQLETKEETNYDGRERPWFKDALRSADFESVWTAPYLYEPEFVPGISLTKQVHDAEGTFLGVAFVDFELRFLSRALEELHVDLPGAQAVIFDESGRVLAHTDPTSTNRRTADGKMSMVDLKDHREPLIRRLTNDLGLPETVASLGQDQLEHIDVDGQRFVVIVHKAKLVRERTSLPWIVAVMVPEEVILAEVRQQGWTSIAVGLVLFLIFLLAVIVASRRLSDAFYGFFDEMQRLAELDLGEPQRIRTPIREMHSLGENLDHMRKGLRSFERYVSAALVRSLIRSGVEASPGGKDQEVTILFTDVEGFTTISEGLQPQELALKLSNNLEEASLIIDAHQGTVDKYIGDSVMAFWNAPDPVPDHALQACQAALKILARIRASAHDTEPLWPIRIGINTTVALVGNLGSISHLDYTVIGDGVNLASRIEGINKNYGTRILIGEQTEEAVSKEMLSRPVDKVIVKGQSRPEPIHELLVERATASPVQLALAEATHEAFTAYLDQRWEQAEAAYRRCLEIQSDDPLALLFIERCQGLKDQTLPDWNGVYS